MIKAILYEKKENQQVVCHMCAHECRIMNGKSGLCHVRKNIDGDLVSLNSDRVIATNMDPIEKKPLYHFLPGSRSFSIAAMGCNFSCRFCQNHSISMVQTENDIHGDMVTPEQLLAIALRNQAQSISYTYTEPTVFFELMFETAKLAHNAGIKNVLVSNGYMSRQALSLLRPYVHAANIDLKSFNDDFYIKYCSARLEPVLETITAMKAMGIWMEVTTLLIPGLNDDRKEILRLLSFLRELDANIPWHVSRFFPQHQLLTLPATSIDSIYEVLQLGVDQGLKFLYGGNIADSYWDDTRCPQCRETLIKRSGYQVENFGMEAGNCRFCRTEIPGIWEY
ncbi:MAG: AmmeMemoRadiSam system radical SAM enzyme [Chrysiogenia bacterium]